LLVITPWQKLSESEAKGGHRRVLVRHFRKPDGTEVQFEVKHEQDGASILALTPDQRVLLVRQFRVGPEMVVDELPGGNVEPGELAENAARRELLEETGHQAQHVLYVGSSLDCGYSTRRRHHFLATGCTPVAELVGDGDEEIELVVVSIEDFRQRLRDGTLTDVAAGYRGLDAAGLL
jgi:ADP-ribose pyrophosphatase